MIKGKYLIKYSIGHLHDNLFFKIIWWKWRALMLDSQWFCILVQIPPRETDKCVLLKEWSARLRTRFIYIRFISWTFDFWRLASFLTWCIPTYCMHKITNLWKLGLHWSLKLQENNGGKHTSVAQICVLQMHEKGFRSDLFLRFKYLSEKLTLSQNCFTSEGAVSRNVLSTALHCLLPSKVDFEVETLRPNQELTPGPWKCS